MTSTTEHAFAVDLGGLIDLLSEHLYSGPEVYVRELMQNGVDAVRMRQQLGDTDFSPKLIFSVEGNELTFIDNGVGLSADDIHQFLATIGRSSKRGNVELIGQFGIGLLACFLIGDSIELTSRSVKGTPFVRWSGRADGSYGLWVDDGQTPAADLPPIGTQIKLKARPERLSFIDPQFIREWGQRYSAMLPFPVSLIKHTAAETLQEILNADTAPWLDTALNEADKRRAIMAYGTRLLDAEPLDYIVINTEAGAVQGVAFVLPWTPTLDRRGQHRVYVRHMLLSEHEEDLMPNWAFFVYGVLDAQALRPNAARDALRVDETLREARDAIAEQLKAYLVNLATGNPATLRRLIDLHYLSIKALAAENDEFLQLFMPWIPFETSAGTLTLPEYLQLTTEHAGQIRYCNDLNLYRQAAQLTLPNQAPVIRAIYTYDSTLLQRYATLDDNVSLQRITPDDLVQDFRPLTNEDAERLATLLRVARDTLLPLGAMAELSYFEPASVPAMAFAHGQRDIKQTRRDLGNKGLWSDILGDIEDEPQQLAMEVHFNARHSLIQQTGQLTEGPLLKRVLGMLYVQAMLLGHHPLSVRELSLLNRGIEELIADALQGAGAVLTRSTLMH